LASLNEKLGRFCKHVSALLLACIILNDFSTNLTPPKLFHRPNMKRFESANLKLKEQVECDLSWPEIIERLKNPPPKKCGKSAIYKFISISVWKKQKITDIDPLSLCTVVQLKQMLKEKGLPISGKKSELILRLVCITIFYFYFLIDNYSKKQLPSTIISSHSISLVK
jgi:hypothetical protein